MGLAIGVERATHRDFFAFEPVSNMTDGINRIDGATDHGMTILRPDETIAGTIRFSLDAT